MAPPAQQQSSQGDNSMAPFWIIIGLFALLWLIWVYAHVQIATGILKVRLWEVDLINLFVPSASSLATQISNSVPAALTFSDLGSISTAVGKFLRYPVALILILLSVTIYISNPLLRFKKTHSIQTLIDQEKFNWPQIMPIANLDLVNTPIDKGPWAMGLSPMQFAKKHRLLVEERSVSSDPNMLTQSRITVTVQRGEAHQIFSVQVGRYFTGIEHLNSHTKALFAAFVARAARDQAASQRLLMQIAASTATGKLDFSGTDELLEKYKNNKGVVKVMQSHAFVMTVMASMLQLARTDGVLASADFLWLKPVDRPLWFMLNSVGRQTPYAEAAGPFAHWLAERALGRKLSVPMVEEAVNALDEAIKEMIYMPDEEPEGKANK